MITRGFSDIGIDVSAGATGEVQTTCPRCSHERRKKNVRCLSVNADKGVWNCHHCGWAGSLGVGDDRAPEHRKVKTYRRPEARPTAPLPAHAREWFRSRGITDEVLERNRIGYEVAYFPQLQTSAPAVVFPYFRGGVEVNRKYRTLEGKAFRLEQGCELLACGVDDIAGDTAIWVEGELDKLSIEAAGFNGVVSVPNGAPPDRVKAYDAQLAFLDADLETFDSVKRHVIAVDSDGPGRRLEAELARRLGPERCSRVRWPEGTKDANDVLVKHGGDELRWYVENAEPMPIEGVVEVDQARDDILRLYANGLERGVRTGWSKLDALYTVRPGELTIVTGVPSSGKSNFVDCLFVNLAALHEWRLALFSPENLPTEQHMAAIAEKYIGKPFHKGATIRMSETELERALAWVGEHCTWIMPASEDDWTVEKVLAAAGKLCLRHGIRGLVIDPWNELESLRPAQMTETEYISAALKRIRVFARQRGVHVWVVVHPSKLRRGDDGKYPVPTLYDCAGSAHWRNKADNGIVVWRDLSSDDRAEIEIHVQKVRFRTVGKRGSCTLYYEAACATYREVPRVAWSETDERYS